MKIRTFAYFHRAATLITAACMLLSSVGGTGWAALPGPGTVRYRVPIIPPACGRVTGGRDFGGKTFLVLVQNLHCHPAVQYNINGIIAALDQKYGVRRVYLEGSDGPVDTSWVASISDMQVRRRIADALTGRGRLTGAEYFSVMSGRPSLIYGLEDGAMYRENFLRLGSIMNSQEEIDGLLADLAEDVDRLTAAYYTPRQKKLASIIKDNEKGRIDGTKYYKLLFSQAEKAGINLADYPNIARYLALRKYSRGLFRRKSAAEFLGMLDKLDQTAMLSEEQVLVNELFSRLSHDKSQREAAWLAAYARLLTGFYRNRLPAADYRYVRDNRAAFELLWAQYVDNDRLAFLQSFTELFDTYYAANLRRNDFFIQNILREPVSAGTPGVAAATGSAADRILESCAAGGDLRVAVTGGFHTEGLVRLLEKHNISYVVVMPNVTGDIRAADAAYQRYAREQYRILSQAKELRSLFQYPSPEQARVTMEAILSDVELAGRNRQKVEQGLMIIAESLGIHFSIGEFTGDRCHVTISWNDRGEEVPAAYVYDRRTKQLIDPAVSAITAENTAPVSGSGIQGLSQNLIGLFKSSAGWLIKQFWFRDLAQTADELRDELGRNMEKQSKALAAFFRKDNYSQRELDASLADMPAFGTTVSGQIMEDLERAAGNHPDKYRRFSGIVSFFLRLFRRTPPGVFQGFTPVIKASRNPHLVQNDSWCLAAMNIDAGRKQVVLYVHEALLNELKLKKPEEITQITAALCAHEAFEYAALNDADSPAYRLFTRYLELNYDGYPIDDLETHREYRTIENIHKCLQWCEEEETLKMIRRDFPTLTGLFAGGKRMKQADLMNQAGLMKFAAEAAAKYSRVFSLDNRISEITKKVSDTYQDEAWRIVERIARYTNHNRPIKQYNRYFKETLMRRLTNQFKAFLDEHRQEITEAVKQGSDEKIFDILSGFVKHSLIIAGQGGSGKSTMARSWVVAIEQAFSEIAAPFGFEMPPIGDLIFDDCIIEKDIDERPIDPVTGKETEDPTLKFQVKRFAEWRDALLSGKAILKPVFDSALRGRLGLGLNSLGQVIVFDGKQGDGKSPHIYVIQEHGREVLLADGKTPSSSVIKFNETSEPLSVRCDENNNLVIELRGTRNVIHREKNGKVYVTVDGYDNYRAELKTNPKARDRVEVLQLVKPSFMLIEGILALYNMAGAAKGQNRYFLHTVAGARMLRMLIRSMKEARGDTDADRIIYQRSKTTASEAEAIEATARWAMRLNASNRSEIIYDLYSYGLLDDPDEELRELFRMMGLDIDKLIRELQAIPIRKVRDINTEDLVLCPAQKQGQTFLVYEYKKKDYLHVAIKIPRASYAREFDSGQNLDRLKKIKECLGGLVAPFMVVSSKIDSADARGNGEGYDLHIERFADIESRETGAIPQHVLNNSWSNDFAGERLNRLTKEEEWQKIGPKEKAARIRAGNKIIRQFIKHQQSLHKRRYVDSNPLLMKNYAFDVVGQEEKLMLYATDSLTDDLSKYSREMFLVDANGNDIVATIPEQFRQYYRQQVARLPATNEEFRAKYSGEINPRDYKNVPDITDVYISKDQMRVISSAVQQSKEDRLQQLFEELMQKDRIPGDMPAFMLWLDLYRRTIHQTFTPQYPVIDQLYRGILADDPGKERSKLKEIARFTAAIAANEHDADLFFFEYIKGLIRETPAANQLAKEEQERIARSLCYYFAEMVRKNNPVSRLIQLNSANDMKRDDVQADVLILCGNDNFDVFREALELYRLGRVKKIIISGSQGRLTVPLVEALRSRNYPGFRELFAKYKKAAGKFAALSDDAFIEKLKKLDREKQLSQFFNASEADIINDIMRTWAGQDGIAIGDDDFILDRNSPNTKRNLVNSRELILDKFRDRLSGDVPLRVVVMQTPLQQLRTMATFNQVFKDELGKGSVQGISYTASVPKSLPHDEKLSESVVGEMWRLLIYTANGDIVPSYNGRQGLSQIPYLNWKDAYGLISSLSPASREALLKGFRNVIPVAAGIRAFPDNGALVAAFAGRGERVSKYQHKLIDLVFENADEAPEGKTDGSLLSSAARIASNMAGKIISAVNKPGCFRVNATLDPNAIPENAARIKGQLLFKGVLFNVYYGNGTVTLCPGKEGAGVAEIKLSEVISAFFARLKNDKTYCARVTKELGIGGIDGLVPAGQITGDGVNMAPGPDPLAPQQTLGIEKETAPDPRDGYKDLLSAA